MNNHVLKFVLNEVPLEAHRIAEGVAPSTRWNVETYAVNFPDERGTSIDSIQLYFDPSDETWHHWPTKFTSDHKPLGAAVAKARTENPELKKYKVRVALHKYSDLSDRPVIRFLPSEGQNPSDAVYRLRDQVEHERDSNHGVAEIVLRTGAKKHYVGTIFMTGVAED